MLPAIALLASVAPLQARDGRGPQSLCLSPPPGADPIEPCRVALRAGLPPARAHHVRLALAGALTRVQRFAEAVELYREDARLAPEDASGRLRLGKALLHLLGQPEAATRELQAAVRLDPLSARAYGVLGAARHALGEHAEAEAAFAEAVRLDPDYLAHRPAAQEMAEASRRGTAWPRLQPAVSGS